MNIENTSTRRTFLKGAVLLGGLAMLLGLHRPSKSGPEVPNQQDNTPSRGYRVTEHVKRYYESARL